MQQIAITPGVILYGENKEREEWIPMNRRDFCIVTPADTVRPPFGEISVRPSKI